MDSSSSFPTSPEPHRTSLSETLRDITTRKVEGDGTKQLVQLGHGKLHGNSDGRCHVTVKRLCRLDSLGQLNMTANQLQDKVAAGEIAILDTTNKALRVADETKEEWGRAGARVDEVVLEADEDDEELDLNDIGVDNNFDFSDYVYLPPPRTRSVRQQNREYNIQTEGQDESSDVDARPTLKARVNPLIAAIKDRMAETKARSARSQRRRVRSTTRQAKTRQATYRRRQRRRLDRALRRLSDERRTDAKKFKHWHDLVWGRVVSQFFDEKGSNPGPKRQ